MSHVVLGDQKCVYESILLESLETLFVPFGKSFSMVFKCVSSALQAPGPCDDIVNSIVESIGRSEGGYAANDSSTAQFRSIAQAFRILQVLADH